MISKQVLKTIEEVKSNEKVRTHYVVTMLEALGFRLRYNGTHAIWKHTKGHRVVLAKKRDPFMWGYQLKAVRTLLTEMEEKGTLIMNKNLIEKSASDTKDWVERAAIGERALKDITKIDLDGHNMSTALKTFSAAFNEQVDFLHKLAGILLSTQEYVLELGLKLEAPSAAPKQIPAYKKPKLSREEIRERQVAGMQKAHAIRKQNKIEKIKQTQQTYPQFARDVAIMAAKSGVNLPYVQRLFDEGLV